MDELSEIEPIPVVVIEEDEQGAKTFISELLHYGFPSAWFSETPDELDDRAIVFCSVENRPAENAWIALETDGSLDHRLAAVKHGASGFVLKPVSVHHAVDLIQNIATGPSVDAPGRVLVVEDSDDMIDILRKILDEAGFEVDSTSDPETFLDRVSLFHPDVIVMDFYLGNVNGLELASVLRQWEQARPIPIIFLTAETRPEIECTVLETGIDHFMTKPLERGRFLAVVNGLVKRSRQLHNIADVDPLTRLLNRRSFGERLDQEIERSRREFRPLAYATLDLDNFKTINDENGHLVGDEVLRQFALLMRNQMRQSDILGRTGGEEFAIALPGATSTQAQIGLERLRETTEKVLFGQNPTIDVSFSYGIAMWNESSTAKSLYARADAELYRAKRAGKNRGFVSETEDSFRET